jgi:hypothetical protein
MFETRTGRIDQYDAAVTPADRALDKPTERFEYSRHRMAASHQFEQSLFTGEQSFSPFQVIDISVQEVPKDNAPFPIPQGGAVHVEPAVDPITATAAIDVARTSGFDRLPPRGKDFWAVVWMNSVGGRKIFQFFERRAEIFSRLEL